MANAKPERPDHEIHQREKARKQRRVAIIVSSVVMVYYLFVFPQAVLDELQAAITLRWSDWAKFAVGLTVNGAFAYLLTFILFSADSVLKGSNRMARWMRSQFAARAAVDKYHCPPNDANALWFRFYDTWALPASPNQHLMVSTYSATYTARAVFYAEVMLLIFLVVTGGSIWVHGKLFHTYDGQNGGVKFAIHIGVVVGFIATFLLLLFSNRLPKGDRIATGCWARVDDVFGRSRTVFENDVLRHAPTLAAAFDRVAELRAGYEKMAGTAKTAT